MAKVPPASKIGDAKDKALNKSLDKIAKSVKKPTAAKKRPRS